MSVLICIPTLSGREPYLVNAIRGITERTDREWNISLARDAPSAGEGWNQCAERIEFYPDTTHLFFFNDDTVPATGWLPPMIEAADQGFIPAPRIEPAGGHIRDRQIFQTHPPMPPAYFPVPRDPVSYFYADLAENQPQNDWDPAKHTNLPFCTVEQWQRIGPFPPFHYGSDVWFSHRARQFGYRTVARMDAVVFNYNANIGRSKILEGVEWTEQMWLDYDGIYALPKYLSGILSPDQHDPLRGTPEGAELVTSWRRKHLEAQRGS